MKTFRIRVQEVLEQVIEIEAENEEEALDRAQEMYDNEEIVLDYSDFIESNVETIKEDEEYE